MIWYNGREVKIFFMDLLNYERNRYKRKMLFMKVRVIRNVEDEELCR